MDNIEGNNEAVADSPDPMNVDALTEEEGQTENPMDIEVDPETKLGTIMAARLGEKWKTILQFNDPTNDLLSALKNNKTAFDDLFWRAFQYNFFKNDETQFQQVRDGVYEDCSKAGLAANQSNNNTGDRLTSLTLGLNQDYKGKFDIGIFAKKIEDTFKWHGAGSGDFISPSFAIIQSSGMGKTKLMKQYKADMEASPDTDVKMLLCKHGEQPAPEDYRTHFDEILKVPNMRLGSDDTALSAARNELIKFLEGLVSRCSKDKNKIVLLFDEAHVLVKENGGGFYVTLRWWLREERNDGKQIVAVFAGTLLSLANYQRVKPALGWTRDATKKYVNYDSNNSDSDLAKKLYDPFYTFTTMAMEHVRVAENERGYNYDDTLFDIRSCGYFGRPLFLAMLKQSNPSTTTPELTLKGEDTIIQNGSHKIVNGRLYNIMARVLLSESVNWKEKTQSVASVLATRVQLGIASCDFVTEAISKGYANLVHFRGGGITSDDKKFGTDNRRFGAASIAFPPDPVCAALAMGLMQDSWTLSKASGSPDNFVGAGPGFWVDQARMVFEQHLFLPNRGDAGEVFAALYMLLCGDVLRKGIDPFMRKFEIDLSPWLQSLEEKQEQETSKKRKAHSSAKEADAVTAKPVPRVAKLAETQSESQSASSSPVQGEVKLNFIQVVRNYFRTHAWFSQAYLKYMYDTAVACYVYANCPAFDLVFPVKIVGTRTYYLPTLVSIKCWDAIGASDMQQAVQDMKDYLRGYRDDVNVKALCILIVIGSQQVGEKPANEGVFPQDDAYVTVVVPPLDRFGVTEAIVATTTASVRAEVLESHSFAHVEDPKYDALRATTRASDRAFGDALIADQQQNDQTMAGPSDA